MKSNIASRIKDYLKEKDISARELEYRAGLGESTIYNILYGKSKKPSITTVTAICDVLGCTFEELVASDDIKENLKSSNNVSWESDLYIECTKAVVNIFNERDIAPTTYKALDLIKEVYFYSMAQKNKEADLVFAEWLIQKTSF